MITGVPTVELGSSGRRVKWGVWLVIGDVVRTNENASHLVDVDVQFWKLTHNQRTESH